MKSLFALACASLLATLGQSQPQCATPAEVRGKHFFNTVTGEYIPIKGIAYYPRPNDGLNNANNIDFYTDEYRHVWERDIAYLRDLNVNTIRLYAVDPSQNHDAFFCALQAAGIYVIVGLTSSCPNCAIQGGASPTCYPPELKTRGETILSVFSKYPNVIGYSAGNEVNLIAEALENPAYNAACQKKFIRDMRAFVHSCQPNMRHIPIGVSIMDTYLQENALYYACRSDPSDTLENAEWFGLNQYRDCETQQDHGYQALYEEFKGLALPIPVLFTELGCIYATFPTVDGYEGQRDFGQIEALFDSPMLEEVTGGFVFEYSTEKSNSQSPWPFQSFGDGNFGVVYFSPEFCDDLTTPCEVVSFPQYQFLADAYGQVASITPPAWDGRPEAIECPANFPPLASYTWATDSVASIACPVVEDFTCSNDCTAAATSSTTNDAITNDIVAFSNVETTNIFANSFDSLLTSAKQPTSGNNNKKKKKQNTSGNTVTLKAPSSGLANILWQKPNKTTTTSTTTTKATTTTTTKATTTPKTPAPKPAECSAYPTCAGLIGNCCPTMDGVFLYCCEGK
jgi:1,3-beta-glucanosyltransferase GAS5